MKKSTKITMLLTVIGAALVTTYLIRRANTKRKLSQVADEGYETAGDILFPGDAVGSKLHFGPVLPM